IPQTVIGGISAGYDVSRAQDLLSAAGGLENSGVMMADFDGDGAPDMVVSGKDVSFPATRQFLIMRNMEPVGGRNNPAPQAPLTNKFAFKYDGSTLHVRFEAPVDQNADGTSLANSLSYAVEVK